ncbi:MAG: DPP IV N-terminal domain-containing protein [Bryobacteraceae bacterium]
MDFGIAKILDPEMAMQTVERTVTVLRLMTPEYASPEQVRGEEVTSASDVYSLGVLLYELLTGHRPYRLKGRAPHEIASVICERKPERPSTAVCRTEQVTRGSEPSITVTPETVSSARQTRPDQLRRALAGDLDNIILMAMRKEPERRYASAEMFAQDICRHLEGMPVRARKDTLVYRVSKAVQRNRSALMAFAGALLLAIVGMLALNYFTGSKIPAVNIVPLTSFPGDETQPSFSPDGERIAFVWDGENSDNSDIYVRPLAGGELLRLTTNTAEDISPTWSPDGERIAWLRVQPSETAVYVASLSGGSHGKITGLYPTRIEAVGRNLDWSPDGKFIVAADKKSPDEPFRLVTIEMSTGHKMQLTSPPSSMIGDSNPVFSPDGKNVAFIRAVSSGVDDIFIVPVNGGDPQRFTSDRRYIISLTWAHDGRGILFSSNRAGNHTLWRLDA